MRKHVWYILRDCLLERRKLDHTGHANQLVSTSTGRPLGSPSRGDRQTLSSYLKPAKSSQLKSSSALQPLKPAPSNVISKLASFGKQSKGSSPTKNITRSSGFSERPAEATDQGMDIPTDEVVDAPKRDDRLALIEDIEVGPTNFKPPFDDPHFQQLEPNSGIRLS